MTALVRQITDEDIPGYHACLDLVAKEQLYLSILAAPPIEQSWSWISPHIQMNRPFLVAADGSQVVGWAEITPYARECFAHRGMLGMGVHPDFRRFGIGASLLRTALAQAQMIGLERVELEVFASNLVAIRLYERFGFAIEGTIRAARKFNGTYDDMCIMGLFL